MNRREFVLGTIAGALAGCSASSTGSAFTKDAQLAVTIARTVVTAASVEPGVSPADVAAANAGLAALQTGLIAVQSGLRTPTDWSNLLVSELQTLGPMLMTDFHANTSMIAGVTLLESFAPLVAADVSGGQAPSAGMLDVRAAAQTWARSHS